MSAPWIGVAMLAIPVAGWGVVALALAVQRRDWYALQMFGIVVWIYVALGLLLVGARR